MKGGLRSGTLTPRNYSGINGIKNLGNTCFLSVVLQSLMSLRSFHVYLHGETATTPTTDTPLTCALRESLKELSSGKRRNASYDPTPVVTAVPVLQNTFARGQHDPEELLHHLMSILDDEKGARKRSNSKAKEEERDNSTTTKMSPEKEWELEEQAEREGARRFENPFYGRLASIINCKACRQERRQTHKFMDLSLAIPANTPPTLENCLKHFTGVEEIYGVRCDRCLKRHRINQMMSNNKINPILDVPALKEKGKGEKEKSLQEQLAKAFPGKVLPVPIPIYSYGVEDWASTIKGLAEKSLSISKTPHALCLHIQRMVAQAGYREPTYLKKGDKIHFPLNLDLSPYCDQKSKAILYSLVAVIEHHGCEDGGHFTVYRKLFPKDIERLADENYAQFLRHAGRTSYEEVSYEKRDWVHISDEVCQRVSEERVLKASAYMLFYEKTSTPSS